MTPETIRQLHRQMTKYKPRSTRSLYDAYRLSRLRETKNFTLILAIGSRLRPNMDIGFMHRTMEDFIMAKKFDWDFIDVKLTDKDRPKLSKFLTDYPNSVVEILDDITELGYKVSVSWVDNQNSYVVSVSGTDRSVLNNKKTVTSWSNNLEEAIAIAGYKILGLMAGKDWQDFETVSSNWG